MNKRLRHDASARGFTAANCDLLKQDDGALLLDTGDLDGAATWRKASPGSGS